MHHVVYDEFWQRMFADSHAQKHAHYGICEFWQQISPTHLGVTETYTLCYMILATHFADITETCMLWKMSDIWGDIYVTISEGCDWILGVGIVIRLYDQASLIVSGKVRYRRHWKSVTDITEYSMTSVTDFSDVCNGQFSVTSDQKREQKQVHYRRHWIDHTL